MSVTFAHMSCLALEVFNSRAEASLHCAPFQAVVDGRDVWHCIYNFEAQIVDSCHDKRDLYKYAYCLSQI